MRLLVRSSLALALLAFSSAAQAQTFQPPVLQYDVGSNTRTALGTPTAISGCSAIRIDSAVTCGGNTGFNVTGFNVLTLDIKFVRTAATGSITFNLECSNDLGVTWYVKQASSVASTGADTITDLTPTRATASASKNFEYTFGINANRCKVTNLIVAGSAGANDKATVYGTLAVTPAS